MFFRSKQSGGRTYLQLVENQWRGGKTQQRVIATVGRLDRLVEAGELESLIQSGSRFCQSTISYYSSAPDETYLSSHQISKLLQVSPSAVVNWVNQGKLSAFRTPGGHRRVRLGDLRRFLESNRMPVPLGLRGNETKTRVFIVDDDSHVIRAISLGLKQRNQDLEVDGCTDGIEALVLIGALHPDLVLLDIHMEGIDGFEVCRRLRRIPRLEGIKIVAMTAYPSEEGKSRIMDYGATDYWVKPVKVEQVMSLLEAGVRRQLADAL